MVQNLTNKDKSDLAETNKKVPALPCKPLEKSIPETATNPGTAANPEANSYKFARERVYVQNNYESADISAIDHLIT